MSSPGPTSTRRALLTGLLAGCGVTALLAACGSGGTASVTSSATATSGGAASSATSSAASSAASTAATTTSSASAAAASSAPAVPTPSSKSTVKSGLPVVNYLCVFASGKEYDSYVTVFNQFNQEHDKLQVNVLPSTGSFTTTRQKILVAHASGTTPGDFYENGWGPFTDMADEGVITDLSPLIQTAKFDLSVFIPNVIQAWQYQGKQWAIPPFVAADALGYNMDLFDASGIKYPPTDPTDTAWTMASFLDTAQKLTKTGTQWGYGGGNSGAPTSFNAFGCTDGTFFGQQPWDDSQQKCLMDTSEFKQAMQYFYDLGATKYHVIPTSDESKGFPKGLDTNLETGVIGMQPIVGLINKAKVKNRLALATLPYTGPAPNQSGRFFADGLHIDNSSKVKGETLSVIQWLMTPDPNAGYALGLGQPVSSLKAGNPKMAQVYQTETGVDPKAFTLQAQYSHNSGNGMLKYGNYGKVGTLVNPIFADFLAGKIDVNTYTTQATQFIDQNLTQKTTSIELKLAANPYAPRRAPWL
jgi:multiple sugar transport system substrate-binding protein